MVLVQITICFFVSVLLTHNDCFVVEMNILLIYDFRYIQNILVHLYVRKKGRGKTLKSIQREHSYRSGSVIKKV